MLLIFCCDSSLICGDVGWSVCPLTTSFKICTIVIKFITSTIQFIEVSRSIVVLALILALYLVMSVNPSVSEYQANDSIRKKFR